MKCPRCEFKNKSTLLECDRCGLELPKIEQVETSKKTLNFSFFSKKKKETVIEEKEQANFDDIISVLDKHAEIEIQNLENAKKINSFSNPFNNINKQSKQAEEKLTSEIIPQEEPKDINIESKLDEPVLTLSPTETEVNELEVTIATNEEINQKIEEIEELEELASPSNQTSNSDEENSLLNLLDFGINDTLEAITELKETVKEPEAKTPEQNNTESNQLDEETTLESLNAVNNNKIIKSEMELKLEQELGRELQPEEIDLLLKQETACESPLELNDLDSLLQDISLNSIEGDIVENVAAQVEETITQVNELSEIDTAEVEKENRCYTIEEEDTDLDSLLKELESNLENN